MGGDWWGGRSRSGRDHGSDRHIIYRQTGNGINTDIQIQHRGTF